MEHQDWYHRIVPYPTEEEHHDHEADVDDNNEKKRPEGLNPSRMPIFF